MMSKRFWIGLALITPMVLGAQSTIPLNPVYKRAQTLVNDGNTAGGRAVIDSMIAIAAPGSNEYAEGVYWRAVLATTAADAEMDYRRLVVDYPQSPRVDDALIRLAQLEIARAQYDGAVRHLARLASEHPDSPARARAGYWMARALFDKKDIQGGCAATADALARTSENDAELKNQITYLNQRCAGVVLTPPAATSAVAESTNPPSPPTNTTTGATPTSSPASSPVVAAPTAPPAGRTATINRPVTAEPKVAVDSPKTTATAPKKTSTPTKSSPKPPAKPLDASPTMVEVPVERSATSESGDAKKVFSVQVAAYNVKSQAAAMVAKLKKSGYEARVDGTAAPFRVRIGKYASSAQASAVQRSLKAKQITGFVVQAEIQ